MRVTNFVISGFLAALAGIIQVARLKSVDPLRGTGLELEVIAAVVIGGTLLTGGYGSLIGSAIGTALTGMLRTGLVLMQVPSNAFRGAIGAIMIAAVVINSFVRKETLRLILALLELKNIGRRFGHIVALKGIDFTLKNSESSRAFG